MTTTTQDPTINNATMRQMVNHQIKNNPRPCLPVSIEFFEEMLECVPPRTFTKTDPDGYYSIMQVGEPMDSCPKTGANRYETFQRMNSNTPEHLRDSRMVAGQWYFTGLKTAYKPNK